MEFTINIFLSSFISKTFGDILEGKLVNKNVPKCLLAQSLLRTFFTGPKPFLEIFTGSTVKVNPCVKKITLRLEIIEFFKG